MAFNKSCLILGVFLLMMVASSFALDMSIVSYDDRITNLRSDEDVMAIFENWLVKHNKTYNALSEKQERFEIFKDNLNYINEVNSKNLSYRLGLTQFTDLTHEEFKAQFIRCSCDEPDTASAYVEPSSDFMAPPASIDWRTTGAVSPVQYQGGCASCWTFGVTAAVEGLMKINTGKLVALSKKEILDCNNANKDCKTGGPQKLGYDYIISNGGITSEQNYPYKAQKDKCDEAKRKTKVYTIGSYGKIDKTESALQAAVARQPVSACVDASSKDFTSYIGGVFKKSCGNKLNHVIAVVGYGTEGKEDYWIVKNSWGTGWGENGFMRLQRNVPDAGGKCGIALRGYFPNKKGVKTIEAYESY